MENLTRMSILAVNIEADALAALVNGGYLRFYDGVQPANANTSPSGGNHKLVEFRFSNPAFQAAEEGIIRANPLSSSMIETSGKAEWFRVFKADGITVVWDGSIGDIGSGATLELGTVNLERGVEVIIQAFSHIVTR